MKKIQEIDYELNKLHYRISSLEDEIKDIEQDIYKLEREKKIILSDDYELAVFYRDDNGYFKINYNNFSYVSNSYICEKKENISSKILLDNSKEKEFEEKLINNLFSSKEKKEISYQDIKDNGVINIDYLDYFEKKYNPKYLYKNKKSSLLIIKDDGIVAIVQPLTSSKL